MNKNLLFFAVLLTASTANQSCQKDSNSLSNPVYNPLPENRLSVDAAVSDSGLLCYLPFNGNLKDASRHGNNGKLTGTISYVADRFGRPSQAVSFNPPNTSWIEIPEDSFVGMKTGTIALDFYQRSSAQQVLISKMSYSKAYGTPNFYQSFIITVNQQNSSTPIQFNIRKEGYCNGGTEGWNRTLNSDSNFVLKQWSNIVVTFNDSVQKMYLNGVLVARKTKTTSPICHEEPIRLGVWWKNDPLFFTGEMDEVRIYNRVLSDTEIRVLAKK